MLEGRKSKAMKRILLKIVTLFILSGLASCGQQPVKQALVVHPNMSLKEIQLLLDFDSQSLEAENAERLKRSYEWMENAANRLETAKQQEASEKVRRLRLEQEFVLNETQIDERLNILMAKIDALKQSDRCETREDGFWCRSSAGEDILVLVSSFLSASE